MTDTFPVTSKLARAKPVYEILPGWQCDVRGQTVYEARPQKLKDYVDFVEKHIGVPINMISTGPKREDIARRQKA